MSLLVVTAGEGGVATGDLVGRGQGYCEILYGTQGSHLPHPNKNPTQSANSAEIGKP